MVGAAHFDRRHLVFGAVCRPVGIVRGNHIRTRFSVVEGGVDDARLHPLGDFSPKRDITRTARQRDEIA